MDEQGLPGLQARYEFEPDGEAVELRLRLSFDPADAGAPETARTAWTALRDRLAGGPEGKPPPAQAGLVTSLASAPLTATADGPALGTRLADFVAEVAAGLDKAATAELVFTLAKSGAAKLPGDFFELDVRLDLGEGWPAIVASPILDGDPRGIGFATAFEQAWQGFDGADGRLEMAVEDTPEREAFWCVRAGAAHGIAIAGAESAKVAYYAVPPLSTSPLSGTIGNLDGDGAVGQFQSVDLDHWWGLFGAELGRLADAAVSVEAQGRFEQVRRALAEAMAYRLLPVTRGETGDGIEEVRAVSEEAATADLRSRPVIVSSAVEVSRGARLFGEPASVLRGRILTPAGAASAAGVSPAAVRLKAGSRQLAYAAPPRQALSLRFEGDRIERTGAPPLRLLLHAATETNAFGLDLGPQSAPVPLIEVPGAPALSVSASMASPDSATLGDALGWTVEIESAALPAAQDRLELALDFEGRAAAVSASLAADGELFAALGRAVRFAGSAPAEPNPEALTRFVALAEAVAEALPAWRPPMADTPPLPGKWRYGIDLSTLPALTVSREGQSSKQLPPWPAVAGYSTPVSEEGIARYEPEGAAPAGAGLRISVPGLRLLGDRNIQVHGRIRRNGSLTGDVEPAFVYHGEMASNGTRSPSLEWQAPRPEPQSASLEAALGALLQSIDADSGRPYALALQAELVQWLKAPGDAPLETRIPLGLIPRTAIGGETDIRVADLARAAAGALSKMRTGIGSDGRDEEIGLAITVFDEAPDRRSLVRLDFRIPVVEAAVWWSPDPA
jgi:hypothetical protein